MTDDQFDDFLNDATLKVADLWEEAGGEQLGINEKYALNDLLTAFFGDKRKSA